MIDLRSWDGRSYAVKGRLSPALHTDRVVRSTNRSTPGCARDIRPFQIDPALR